MAKENSDSPGWQPPSPRNVNIYDATNSFVKKVTTKMTDLIPQSLRLSKWFNSTDNIADTIDGKENTENAELEEEEQPPPSKRIRMDRTYPPGTFSIQTRAKGAINAIDPSKEQHPARNDMTEEFLDQATPGPSGLSRLMSSTAAVQADIRGVTSRKSDLNSLTSLTNDGIANGTDDNSESSETSGCSSLIQQMNRFEGPALYSSTFSSRKRHIDDKLRFTSPLQSSRSSFLNSSSRETLSSRRPRFNESVVTSVLQRTSLSSPFYDGNTTFGGANMAGFYGRNSFNDSLNQLELKVPKRTNVEVTPSNATESDSSGMSQTAKKILEALEHFSSPISDAKKIPLKNASNAVSSILSRKRAEGAKTIGLRHLTRELTVPTVPDILKLRRRQKLQDTTLTVRKMVSARSDPPPSPQEYRLRMEINDGEKYRGKLKSRAKVFLEKDTYTPNLPNIPLPITTLPNFNFSLPPPSMNFVAGKTAANKENTYTFASPIKMTVAEEEVEPVKGFTFSNPIDIDDSGNKTKTSDLSSLTQNTGSGTTMPSTNFIWSGSSTAPRLKAKVKDRQDNTVEFATPTEPKMGSVIDLLCPKSNKTESSAVGQSDLKLASETVRIDKTDSAGLTSGIKSTPVVSWECSECLIKNNDTDKQCNACKVPRPDPEGKTSTTVTSTTDTVVQTKPVANDCFGSQFKLSKDQWECTSCCVRNKRSDDKCVACCTPKPENNTVQQTVKPQNVLNPLDKFKPVAGSWECSGCLLRNAENVLTCPCCDASKPNAIKKIPERRRDTETTTETSTINTENVATASDIMNKFKPSKDSWECPGCLVRNNNSVTTCPCCSTAKPSSGDERTTREHVPTNGFGDKFAKPKGAWNCDSCLLQNDAKHTECVACQAPKPGVTKTTKPVLNTDSTLQFKFGVPPSASTLSNHSGGFKFGIDKADTQSKSDAASSLNGFKFGSAQQNSGAAQFTFGIPKEESKVTNEAPKSSSISSTGLLFNTKTPEKSESTKKDSESKQETSFSAPTSKSSTTASEKPNTSVAAASTTSITPIFTFGVEKSGLDQSASNKEKEKSITATESAKLTVEAAAPTTTISESASVTSKTTLPTPIFSFGLPSTKSTDSTALFSSTAATNTTTSCLPTFAQSTFTFSDSKTTSQPLTTTTTFGQPLTSTALSTNLSFGENKVVETVASSFTKSTSDVSTTSSVFPIVSSSASFFNNTINNEPKTTIAFGSDKSAFSATCSKPGFGATENKYSTFGSNTEDKPTIFGTTETKLPVFNPPSQTPAANTLPTFGAFGSGSTPVFGSVTTAPAFGAVTTTPAIFSSTKPSEPTIASSSPLFTFGSASSQQPASGGFNFTANANPAMNPPAAKPLFTFGSNSSATQNTSNMFDGSAFGANASSTNTPNFAFNPPKQETPFGQGAGTTPMFGGPQADSQNQAKSFPSTAPPSTGFNFGSTASPAATSGFNFGTMPSSTPSGGFNFNPLTTSTPAVAFDPNSRPSFNFTKGSAPTSFNATPQSQRKIKKAFRRCPR